MSKNIPDKEFHSDMDKIFEKFLDEPDYPQILIKDVSKNIILQDINYSKVFFDSDLNIFKLENGVLKKVDNENFVAIVVKKHF